jgi:hypothetical protein
MRPSASATNATAEIDTGGPKISAEGHAPLGQRALAPIDHEDPTVGGCASARSRECIACSITLFTYFFASSKCFPTRDASLPQDTSAIDHGDMFGGLTRRRRGAPNVSLK